MKTKIISHVDFLDRGGNRIHETLSAHLRNLTVGQRVALMSGSIVEVAHDDRSFAQFDGGSVYEVEHTHHHRVGRRSAPDRHRAIVELIVCIKIDCQTQSASSRSEVSPPP